MRSSTRSSAVLLLLCLMVSAPLLTGCLERSTTVGDRYSGTIIVATSPDNPQGPPKLDVPESMRSRISLIDYSTVPESESAAPGGESSAPGAAPGTGAAVPRVGTRVVFTDLTSGQFGQLGDIVAAAWGDSVMSMDLSAKRNEDVVRFRGNADLTNLAAPRDLVDVTITFGGPITATNGEQVGERTVHWAPESGKPSDFSADATYPDPATAAVKSWSWFLALICLVTVLIVARLAFAKRDRSPRPGRPRRSGKTKKPAAAPVRRTGETESTEVGASSRSSADR